MRKIAVVVGLLVAGLALAAVTTETSSSGPYTCNGATVSFTAGFRFLERSHLLVQKTLTSSGAVSTLALGTDYAVTGAGASSGTVTLTAGSKCPTGYTLAISRSVPLTQPATLPTQGPYTTQAIEKALDRVTMQAQQLNRDRAALAAVVGTGNPDANRALVRAAGSTRDRELQERFSDVVHVKDFGAVGDGVTDDTAAIQGAITAAAGTRTVIFSAGDFLINGTITAGGAHLAGLEGAKLIIGTSALSVFTVTSGFSVRDLTIQMNTLYVNADAGNQRVFYSSARATGVVASNIYAYANTADATGATRAGALFRGYFAQSRFTSIRTVALRNGIFSDGEDVSGITVADCAFENVERGVYLTGLNPHVGNPLVSRGFSLSNNRLVNTSTQASNYNSVEGRNLYNLQNLGSVSISGGVSEYAIERAVYVICSEDVQISGMQIRGSEGIKFSGTHYDATVEGGPVDRKSKNIAIYGVQLTSVAADKHAIILITTENVLIEGVRATGNGAHSAIYVETYANHLSVRGVRAYGFKRGLVWLRAFKDLPGAGTLPTRPSGHYAREFRDILVEGCEGDLVNTLGSDPAYTPARVIPFVYTLLEDDLVATLTGSSRLFYDVRILRNKMNPSSSDGNGTGFYRAASLSKAFLDINYATRVVVEGNEVRDLGGVSLTGITIGSATTNVMVKHSIQQVTNFDTVPPLASPFYVSAGSEIELVDTQLFGTTRAAFRYRVTPQILTGTGGTDQRVQTQDLALAYRVVAEVDAVLASTEALFLGGPCGGSPTARDFLTGVLDGTLSTSALVSGEVVADGGRYARFSSVSPWATVPSFNVSATFAADFTLTTATGATTKVVVLTNTSGAARAVRVVTEYLVQRTAVL